MRGPYADSVRFLSFLAILSQCSPGTLAEPTKDPHTTAARVSPPATAVPADIESYDVGLLVGTQLASNGLTAGASNGALLRGVREALAGKRITRAQKDVAQEYIRASRAAFAAHNVQLAHDFLRRNAGANDVKSLQSGVQYRVLAAGDPKASPPGPRDQVTLRYRTALADGTEIDRSDEHGQAATFRLDSVIQGWREALAAMTPGAKWRVFVPPELGYGSNAPPPIPPGALLVYDLELLQIEPAKPMSPQMIRPHAQTVDPTASGSAAR